MVLTARHLRRWTTGLLVVTGVIATVPVILHLTAKRTAWHDLYSCFSLSGESNLAA